MEFFQDVNASPAPVRFWVWWMVLVLTAVPTVLIFRQDTRRIAVILALAGLLNLAFMLWLHAQVGFVRLLGLPHVLIWTPQVIWLAGLLRRGEPPGWPRAILAVLALTMVISLAFDYTDVIRYIAGDRAELV